MSDITLCPQCATRFKVSEEQLAAHDGMVRCGRCQSVFNAREHLQEDEPSPQLSLLIDEEPPSPTADSNEDTVLSPAAEQAPEAEAEAGTASTPEDEGSCTTDAAADTADRTESSPDEHPDLRPIPNLTGLDEEPVTLAQQVQFVDDPTEDEQPKASKSRHYIAAMLGTSLFVLLAAQGTYHFRDTLAVKLPGLKPLLVEYCRLLDCSVELPREPELLSIESSELEADAKLVNVITLHALLHNRAQYAQAWPSLELTLTDSHDQVIARRAFHPGDYLDDKASLQYGIGHNREQQISLKLDTTDLRPSGYRLFLFYPPL